MLLPNTPSGRLAAATMQRTRDEKAAASIAHSSKHELSSDEFMSHTDVDHQIDTLKKYVAGNRERFQQYFLPRPVGWRIAMLILQPPEKTSGGLELPTDVTEAYAHKSMQGVVIALGGSAYTDRERFPDGPWAKLGERILFKRYDAQTFELANGQRLGFLNDTQPIANMGYVYDLEGIDHG